MQLPKDQIGPSDILDYRECPKRFELSMTRHEGEDWHERESYASAYGKATHDAVEYIERDGVTDEQAIDLVWPIYQHWLDPDDAESMKKDLAVYRSRTMTGYRLIGTEIEMRMPLLRVGDRIIYFRGRIDSLYQHMDNPAVFVQRDYKTSRFPKTYEEVQKDIQQWSYNALIHYNYPECESLTQIYDQLKFGDTPIHKNPEQRKQITTWLRRQVTAILNDDVLKPTSNQWCYTCPLMMDCPVTHRSTDWWLNRLAVLAPEHKVGRKIVVTLTQEHGGFDIYVDILAKAKLAKKTIDRYIEAVENTLKEMPAEQRLEFGHTLGTPRRLDYFTPDALRQIREEVGDEFFQFVNITKKGVNEFYGEGTAEAEAVLSHATKKESAAPLKRVA